MKLSAVARSALTTMAAHPPERPFVLYRTKSGPSLLRPSGWLDVPQREVDALVAAGLLEQQGPYWVITTAGRAAVSDPMPARSRRRVRKGAR